MKQKLLSILILLVSNVYCATAQDLNEFGGEAVCNIICKEDTGQLIQDPIQLSSANQPIELVENNFNIIWVLLVEGKKVIDKQMLLKQ